MYVPAHFAETRPEELARIIREYPLGVLVTHDANVGARCERLISMSDGRIISDDARVIEVPELVGAH